jgi:filamentous hemagglutinin family protein
MPCCRWMYCWPPLAFAVVLHGPTYAAQTLSTAVDARGPTTGAILITQLVPDDTLGTAVTPGVIIQGEPADRIDGGTIRGTNLFHSFEAFNVDPGQRLYFANPFGIENILSRVTGGGDSNIDGLLGIDGTANLFLLNPNGIFFGPDARLDISGSFLASTGNSLTFADGSEFSATPPDNELLSVSVPLGVQFNSENPPQGNLTSVGRLETDQNLTLLGNNLYFEGQLLTTGDLSLQAVGTVTIRNTPQEEFVAQAGNNLFIQGSQLIDILMFQNLDRAPLVSGSNLTLISDGTILTDTTFESGGDLQFLTLEGTPGQIISEYGLVALARDNVILGNYTGAALGIATSGNIQAGNISITEPSQVLVPDGSGSYQDLMAGSRGAILLAGVDSAQVSRAFQQTVGTILSSATPTGTPIVDSTGIPQPPGSIVVNSINTSANEVGGNGGPIVLEAPGNIIATGAFADVSGAPVSLGSFAFGSAANGARAGDGGTIRLSAGNDILTGNLDTSSLAISFGGNVTAIADDGGAVTLAAGNDITTGNVRSPSVAYADAAISASAGNGGMVKFSAGNDITAGDLNTFAYGAALDVASSGEGGNIALVASNGSIGGNRLLSFSIAKAFSPEAPLQISGNGGAVALAALNQIAGLDMVTLASSNPSGDVLIQGLGDLQIQDLTLTTSAQLEIDGPFGNPIQLDTGGWGQSGNAQLTSFGNMALENVLILSHANGTIPGGNIALAGIGTVTLDNSRLQTSTSAMGVAGNIVVNNVDNLEMQNGSLLFTNAGDNAEGGNISITANVLIGSANGNNDIIASAAGGNGGRIEINAGTIVDFVERSGLTIEQLRSNQTNDISASSGSSPNDLNLLDLQGIDPTQGLTELPETPIDAASLIEQSLCELGRESEFFITGRGGLPTIPIHMLESTTAWEDWYITEPDLASGSAIERGVTEQVASATTSQPLTEAQGMVKTADGQVTFLLEPPMETPYAMSLQATDCRQLHPRISNRLSSHAMIKEPR